MNATIINNLTQSALRHCLSGLIVYSLAHGFTNQAGVDAAIAGLSAIILAAWKWYDAQGRAELIATLKNMVGQASSQVRQSPRAMVFPLALLLLTSGETVRAADLTGMPVKAPPAGVSATCTATSCISWYAGLHFANFGGTFNLVSTGIDGLAANGLLGGGQFGYEYFSNNIYARAELNAGSDLSQNGGSARDRFNYGFTGCVGYSLAGLLGGTGVAGATPAVPSLAGLPNLQLMTPYVCAGSQWRHTQQATESGLGLEALVSPTVTLNADYRHYHYGSGTSSGGLTPTQMVDEDAVMFSLNKHFNIGH